MEDIIYIKYYKTLHHRASDIQDIFVQYIRQQYQDFNYDKYFDSERLPLDLTCWDFPISCFNSSSVGYKYRTNLQYDASLRNGKQLQKCNVFNSPKSFYPLQTIHVARDICGENFCRKAATMTVRKNWIPKSPCKRKNNNFSHLITHLIVNPIHIALHACWNVKFSMRQLQQT